MFWPINIDQWPAAWHWAREHSLRVRYRQVSLDPGQKLLYVGVDSGNAGLAAADAPAEERKASHPPGRTQFLGVCES